MADDNGQPEEELTDEELLRRQMEFRQAMIDHMANLFYVRYCDTCQNVQDEEVVPATINSAIEQFVELLQRSRFLPETLTGPALDKLNALLSTLLEAAELGYTAFKRDSGRKIVLPN